MEYCPLSDEKIGYLLVVIVSVSGIFLFIDGLIQFTKTAQVFVIGRNTYKIIGVIFLLISFIFIIIIYSWFLGIRIASKDEIILKYLWPRKDAILNNDNIEYFKIIYNRPKRTSPSQQLKIISKNGKAFISVGFDDEYKQNIEKIIEELKVRGIPEGK